MTHPRLMLTYRASVLGMQLLALYAGKDPLLESILASARRRGLHGFQPTGDYRCAASWHARAAMTYAEKLRRERIGREARGERYDRLMVRQAA